MTHVLELDHLTKCYGSRTALDGVSLVVPPGTVVGVIGPNGAGKTTIMRLILGLIRPSGGSVSILGTNPWPGHPRSRERVGYLPGELKLDGRVTGADMIQYFARISGPVDQAFVDELVECLGLDPSRRISALSKGNKQKIGLVQALMHRPDLLVLDEPTSGLDPLVQREFLALVTEARTAGQATFLSSHVISEVQQCADHVAVLRRGQVVRSASVAKLRAEAPRSVRLGLEHALTEHQSSAPRRAGLTFVESAAASAHEVVDSAAVLDGQLSGSPIPLLQVLPHLALSDVVIEEPDLERAVLDLYSSGPPSFTGSAPGGGLHGK